MGLKYRKGIIIYYYYLKLKRYTEFSMLGQLHWILEHKVAKESQNAEFFKVST